ncbi:zinc-ribbon domain-containing protein [Lacinutrix chionoecetis]
MIFFFGTRASKIGQKRLNNVTCPYCQTQNSFIATTYGRYVHFFWIPLFPIGKTTLAECTHCKKTYAQNEFTDQIQRSLQRENEINPSKRPFWHGCGCLIIVAFFVTTVGAAAIGAIFYDKDIDNMPEDVRFNKLKEDRDRVTSNITFETDSIAFSVQQCINSSVEGLNTENIKYASQLNGEKLMLILKVLDMKSVEKSSRKELVFAVEDCLDELKYTNITERYIAVDGKWNMLMVKTPYEADLEGKYASEAKLLRFYDNTLTIQKEEIQ